MARKINPDLIERDRKRKRINIPLSDRHAGIVTRISGERGFPTSRVVGYMVGLGIEAEVAGRIALDRPEWPTPPTAAKYVQAAFSPNTFSLLIDVAESSFEPLNVAAASLFQIGLAEYLAGQQTKVTP